MKAFKAQMDIQHQELASAQSKLDQKDQEVELLCQQLENLQKTNCEMAQNYETQLCVLKSQFLKLTHSYDKLLKQKNRQSREISKESPETSFLLNNLRKKMEEFQDKSREWDKKGTVFQNHLIYLDAQQKLLSEKCNLFQNIEASFSEMRNELQSRDALWRKIQLEYQQLRAELLKIIELKDMQEMHRSSFVQLTEQSENKNADFLLQAQSQKSQREVLSKIRNHLYREEPSHCSEQEGIRTEISDLTEELHQKEITIATIMEKASLLERQLKMELQIKDKLLAKQQLLNFKHKVIKSENTHLKEIIENQKYKSCMSIDLSNKKHGDFTASVQKLEHENARLQNSLVKLQNHTETLMLGGVDKRGETEHSYQTHSKMQEKEDRLDRGHEMELDDKPPSPATEDPLCFGGLFPEKGRTGTLLSHAYDAEEIKLSSSPETSFLATTEKFLQEEEKHTREFEERLNSHLEELRRLSENTLKKYTGLQ
ncbi:deuterosome assembly protein 1 isoform X3 [Meleagris gallopavo]|uniref:deuterosome assembly protein 1 isoform X3 n=1 Tax=Meleagris gallopavo TaxID=9103 RepID=UPI00093937E3|nr:deuterosome assembly protein 1 isoform X3 [Meleagris gallopavo]